MNTQIPLSPQKFLQVINLQEFLFLGAKSLPI